MSSYNYRSRPSAGTRSTHYGPSRRPSAGNRHSQYINPERFVHVAKPLEQVEYIAQNQFKDFEINELLKENIIKKGYVTPSPIQDQTIPLGLAGKDIIGIANTGTGKTAAFALPVLNQLMNDRTSKALIIAPTRELAQQIEDEFRSIAKGSGLSGALLIGGNNIGPQIRDLRGNPRVVVGTPGRIKDHLERRSLDLAPFNLVVLDEVDRMLDMGFVNDVRSILNELAPKRQSFFFSATLDPRVQGLIESFATDPTTVSVKTAGTSENINQDIVRYTSTSDKISKLHDILIKEDVEKIIVFDETQRKVEKLSKELIDRGFSADSIHGGKTQGQRARALNRFRKNEITILVATDVAARGIDVADITHVINYSQPNSYEDYIHRVGRAGRAGRVGHALTFVSH